MSSDILAPVEALVKKGNANEDNVLRSAEYLGRAAEVARELGPDNLVTIDMQLLQSVKLGSYGIYPCGDLSKADVFAAHRAQSITLLFDAVEALERRRAADMLLDGKCSAAEEEWLHRKINNPSAASRFVAPLVGYDTFLFAASLVTSTLTSAVSFRSELSDAHFRSFGRHIVRAAYLMTQPRRCNHIPLTCEKLFSTALRQCVGLGERTGFIPPFVQLLAGAWQQLERSGVLQARAICTAVIPKPSNSGIKAKITQNVMASDLVHSCAFAGCGAKELYLGHFKRCLACKTVVYCSQEHHMADWPAHKAACKAARSKAAAGEAAPPAEGGTA